MKRILRGVILGLVIALFFASSVLAAYYAYITVEEEDGNAYTNLPVICSRNITQLVNYDIITSSGLDTRVLTGDAEALPHILANDKFLFVTDLEAHEEKTLIFYTGATSLSDFPIIVGYDGYITTEDDPDLELTYVMEFLASGYFDSSSGADKNILYKEEAFRVYVPSANTLEVQGLEAGGGEAWDLRDTSFTSGEHTIYVLSNGLAAYLYVDDFEIAEDTEDLFASDKSLLNNTLYTYLNNQKRSSFYAEDMYWAFYQKGTGNDIYYKTSLDGSSWSSEYTISAVSGDTNQGFGVWFRDGYMHISYGGKRSGDDYIRYRRGVPAANSSITWSAAWQTAGTTSATLEEAFATVDGDGYPFIMYALESGVTSYSYVTKSSTNDGTWSTAGGYPLELAASTPYDHFETITNYPSSNKMYAVWVRDGVGDYDYYLWGRYYNGSSWGGSHETIDDGSGSGYEVGDFCAIADDDDNVYFIWKRSPGGVYFRIRYSDGVFGAPVLITASGSSPTLAYNDDNGYVYLIYIRAGSVRARVLAADEISEERTLFTPAQSGTMSATPYGDHIGIMYNSASDYTQHGYLSLPWDWNDNANNWTLMQGNVMPYADYFMVGIDGTLQLHYQPDTIIQGTTLPDEESDHDGIITWGSNPAGVTCETGMFSSESDEGVPSGNYTSSPGWTDPHDMIGPTGQPGWTAGLPVLADNPLYPLMNVVAGLTNVPLGIIWILFASFWVMAAMVLSIKYMPHQLYTALIGGGVTAFFVHMGIYPFWVIFIFVALAAAIIVSERMPTVG